MCGRACVAWVGNACKRRLAFPASRLDIISTLQRGLQVSAPWGLGRRAVAPRLQRGSWRLATPRLLGLGAGPQLNLASKTVLQIASMETMEYPRSQPAVVDLLQPLSLQRWGRSWVSDRVR